MNAKISARILALVTSGLSIDAAVDQVLGAGTYARIADDLYAALRKEG